MSLPPPVAACTKRDPEVLGRPKRDGDAAVSAIQLRQA